MKWEPKSAVIARRRTNPPCGCAHNDDRRRVLAGCDGSGFDPCRLGEDAGAWARSQTRRTRRRAERSHFGSAPAQNEPNGALGVLGGACRLSASARNEEEARLTPIFSERTQTWR